MRAVAGPGSRIPPGRASAAPAPPPPSGGVGGGKAGRRRGGQPPLRPRRDGGGEPGPLSDGQPPVTTEHGEELTGRFLAASRLGSVRRLARGGGGFTGRFLVRFGCN